MLRSDFQDFVQFFVVRTHLHQALTLVTIDALVHASDRKLPNFARNTVMRNLVRLETRSAVLALLISFSGRNEASRVIARVALVGSRVAVLSFVAVGASGSSSVLVLSASAGNANRVANLVGVEPLCALSARSGASRCQLVAPNRAVGAHCLSGGRGGFPGRAIGALDSSSPARVVTR